MSKIRKNATPKHHIRELISQWKRSGLTKKEFCDEHGLNYYTFIGWLSREKRDPSGVGFREVKITPGAGLFAEVTRGEIHIRFHQPFPVEYFQALLK